MYSIYGARSGVTAGLRIRILSLPKDPPRKNTLDPLKGGAFAPLNPPLGRAKDDAPQRHRICKPRSLLATFCVCKRTESPACQGGRFDAVAVSSTVSCCKFDDVIAARVRSRLFCRRAQLIYHPWPYLSKGTQLDGVVYCG